MVALVRTLKGRYTIVLIEHKMDIIMSVSDRISVMHFGSLIAEGTPPRSRGTRKCAAPTSAGLARLMLELKNGGCVPRARTYPHGLSAPA